MTFVTQPKSLSPCRPDSSDRPAGARAPAAEPWRAAWVRTAAITGFGFAALIAMFFDGAANAVRIWYESPTFNHCFAVLPIAGYLVWQRRGLLMAAPPEPAWLGLAALPVLTLGWLLGHVADVLVVQQLALVAMLQVFAITVLGWRASRVIAFPLFFLVFAVPLGKFLVPELQDLTAAIAVRALRTIDIPVFLDGVFLSTPTNHFEVAEACSGVRFLIAMIVLGSLFAHLYLRSIWRQAAFLALALLIPLIGNGLRAFGIVYLAYLTDNRVAAGVDHLVYGWVFFMALMIALLAIGWMMRDAVAETGPPPAAPRRGGERGRVAAAAALALALAGVAPGYAALIDRGAGDVAAPRLALPESIGAWTRLDGQLDDWRPSYASADAQALATYAKGDRRVHLFVAYYARQRQGAEVVSQSNRLEGGRWLRSASGLTNVSLAGRAVRTRWVRMLRDDEHKRLVWSWLWYGGRYAAESYRAKIIEVEAKLLGRSQAAAAIAVAAGFEETPDSAATTLEDFLSGFDSVERLLAELSRNR